MGSGLQQETFKITKDREIGEQKLLKRLTVREKNLHVIVEVADLGVVVHWDRGTKIYVKVDPRWKSRVKGLCGNYNDNEADDFQTPSGGITEASANIFGDSWKLQAYCPAAEEVTVSCTCAFFLFMIHTNLFLFRTRANKGQNVKCGR